MNVTKHVQAATLHVPLLAFVQHTSKHDIYHRTHAIFRQNFVRVMCGSNRPRPTPLPGKTGDITFLADKNGDVPRGRA